MTESPNLPWEKWFLNLFVISRLAQNTDFCHFRDISHFCTTNFIPHLGSKICLISILACKVSNFACFPKIPTLPIFTIPAFFHITGTITAYEISKWRIFHNSRIFCIQNLKKSQKTLKIEKMKIFEKKPLISDWRIFEKVSFGNFRIFDDFWKFFQIFEKNQKSFAKSPYLMETFSPKKPLFLTPILSDF